MKSMLRIALAVALLAVPLQLRAGYLGNSVELTFEKPSDGCVLIGDRPPAPIVTNCGTSTVGPGVEFTGALDWNIDVSDTSIRLALGDTAFGSVWGLVNAFGFQGFRLRDADGTVPDIIG